MEELLKKNNDDLYLIPRRAYNSFNNEMKNISKKDKNTLIQAYDKFNNLFKAQAVTSVSFHINNSIGNVFNSWVMGGVNMLNPKKNLEAINILRGKEGNIGKYSYKQIMAEMNRRGVLDNQLEQELNNLDKQSFLEGKVDNLFEKDTPLKKLGKSINPLDTKNFALYKGNRKLSNYIESQAKVINFITHLENGMSLSEAENLTKKALFDYSDLTDFESTVLKRIVPFYTFMRKNLPAQFEAIQNKPFKYMLASKTYTESNKRLQSDKERALKPSYLDNALALGNGNYLNYNLPMTDIDKLGNPKGLLSSLAPAFKTPLELALNKQLYSGYDISKYDKPTEKLKYAIESVAPLLKKAEKLYNNNQSQDNSNVQNTSNSILSKSLLNSMVTKFDLNKAEKQTFYEYVTKLQNQYYETVQQNPSLKDIAKQKQDQRNSSKKKNPLLNVLK
jgi:hypothetical protein